MHCIQQGRNVVNASLTEYRLAIAAMEKIRIEYDNVKHSNLHTPDNNALFYLSVVVVVSSHGSRYRLVNCSIEVQAVEVVTGTPCSFQVRLHFHISQY